MMLSVMVVGAGAAFSDQSKIKNTEAVDMCTALNIIGGYPDGTFKPEGNITRAEVTKMICVALNGGEEPAVSTNATPTFNDVRGNANAAWAEGYIESCATQGIVSGVGGGKFAPNGNVTGTQLAKMLLVALGYKADIQNFTGNAWATNVNVLATQKGLYKDLEKLDVSAALTRDNAAQMIWNALQAKEVKYEYTLVSENGQLTSKITVKDDEKTLLEDKYNTVDTDKTTGILTGISYNSTKGKYTYTLEDESTYTTKDNFTDLLGHNVTFVVKGNSAKDVYGAYAKDSTVIVSGLIGDIDFTDFTAAKKSIEVDDVDYDVDSTAVLAEYGKASGVYTYTENKTTTDTKNYYKFTAIDNDDDNDIDLIIYYPVTFAKVSYVTSKYIKLDQSTVIGVAGTEYDKDYTVYEKAAKDDYAVAAYDTSLKTDGIITLVEEQTGKVTSYGGDNAVIGGTSYDYKSLSQNDISALKNALNKNIDFWAVNGYIVRIDATGSVDLSDYVLVTGVSGSVTTSGYYEAAFLFTDGTTVTAPVKTVDNASGKETHPREGTLYTYEISSGKYNLTTVSSLSTNDFDGVAGNAATWTPAESSSDANAKVDVKDKGNTTFHARFASDAVVFVNDDGDYSVKTGADLAKVTATATVKLAGAEKNSQNAMSVTFAYIETTGVASTDTMYGFITSDISNSKDSDGTYQTATIWTGSKSETLTTDDGVKFPSGTDKGSVVAYKLNSDGAISEFVTVPSGRDNVTVGQAGALTVIDGDEVTINNVTYKIDKDDTTIIYVDKSANKGAENGSIAVANEKETTEETAAQYHNNVYFYTDDTASGTKTLDLLVVDIDNDWDGEM